MRMCRAGVDLEDVRETVVKTRQGAEEGKNGDRGCRGRGVAGDGERPAWTPGVMELPVLGVNWRGSMYLGYRYTWMQVCRPGPLYGATMCVRGRYSAANYSA